MNYILFDFGASFIKIYKNNEIIRIHNDTNEIINLNFFKNIINEYIDDSIEFIGISSQMHGFILFDENEKYSDFISWKKKSEINILNDKIFNDFYLTGLEKRNDLPINNLYDYLIKNNIKNKKIYFKNLTEAILDESYNITHSSMACGHGFYDIFSKKYKKKFINFFKKKFNVELLFDKVIEKKKISGIIKLKDRKIPVYIGIGDLQASINAFNIKDNVLILNLATGSQIINIIHENEISNKKNTSYRPFFENKYLKCITHIPSGRFLNIYVNFFKELDINFWDYIENITINDLYNSSLKINTNIFQKDGINIENIQENNFNIKNLISSILYNYIFQYIKLIKENNFKYDYIIISGGIGKKVKLIKEMLHKELNTDIQISDINDDSLIGVEKFIL